MAQLVPVSEFCSLQTDAIARSARNPGRMRAGLHVPVVRFPLRTIPMNRIRDAKLLTIFSAALALILSLPSDATAQTQIVWQGHTWNVTNGGMAGVARGNPSNVSVDSKGRLHLSIQKRDGAWTASELFTIDNLGFGTYQWVVEGNAWDMDPVTVLGLFPYGPVHKIGGDATNEIDIEFSKWNNTCVRNADFTVYPLESRQGKPSYELNFKVDTKTNLTTARMVWSSKSIVFTMMKGNQPIGTHSRGSEDRDLQFLWRDRHTAATDPYGDKSMGVQSGAGYESVVNHSQLPIRALVRARFWPLFFLQSRDDLAHLLDVIDVMACHVCAQFAHRHLAPLRMDAVALPLPRTKVLKHSQIGFAQQPKHRQRIRGIPRGVVSNLCPHILIEAGQIQTIPLDHLAIPPRTREFILGEMSKNLRH